MLTDEVWKEIPGFEGLYEVSDKGSIRSLDRTIRSTGEKAHTRMLKGRVLKVALSNGYHSYSLWKGNCLTVIRAHHAVAYAFIGPRPPGTYICHRDGSRTNNNLQNLYYGTPLQNSADTIAHGTIARGVRHGAAKLKPSQVLAIRARARLEPQSKISAEFGIAQSQVSRIVNNHQWQNLPSQQEQPR